MKLILLTRLSAVAMVILIIGCVDRRFVVDTNVPGAQIYVDGKPIGPSPADAWYTYPGCYEFKAVAPGHEPLIQTVKLKPKWYDYPGLDFVAEVLWPFRIEDVREIRLDLEPTRPIQTDQLLSSAEELRARAGQLPPSSVPDDNLDSGQSGPAITPPRLLAPGPPFGYDALSPEMVQPGQMPQQAPPALPGTGFIGR